MLHSHATPNAERIRHVRTYVFGHNVQYGRIEKEVGLGCVRSCLGQNVLAIF